MADVFERLKAALADRYIVERELGSGGMATVYLAQDLKHDRQVAIKVLRPDLAAALGAERFHREIKIAAQLQHPNILPLHDSGEADGLLYYVMPYVEGMSLRDKLAKVVELPIADAVRMLRDVVDALTEAHAHGVVHRDIKPENILLSGRHALVTDFGVAKAVSEAADLKQLTTTGVALGTPAYMAPEQASADPHSDHRVDIYAVGAVAYELLTGRAVFLETTPHAVLAAHMTQAPEPPSTRRASVPPALDQAVLRCLEKKPADRWQSAEELLVQLEALATPSEGVPPTETRPMRMVQGKRSVVATVGAAVVAVVAAVAILLGMRSRLELDPNLVGVAPFDVLTTNQDLDVWREGIVDLLSRSLDGAGPLRTLSPTMAIRRWEGRAETERAAAFGRNRARSDVVQQMLDTLSADALFGAARLLVRYPDSAEAATRVARARMTRDSISSMLSNALSYRGHLEDAFEVLSGSDWRAPNLMNYLLQRGFGEMAEFNAFPAESVDAVFGEWLNVGWGPGASHGIRWWAAREDTSSLRRFVWLTEQMVDPRTQLPAVDRGFINWVLSLARAHLVLARGDTATALTELEAIQQWPTPNYTYTLRLTRAQLLSATGRDTEAATVLDQMSQLESDPSALDVIWVLERARVNERLGNHDKAVRDYSFVMDVWRTADDILQPFVEEARTAVTRLAGEPRG